MSTSPWITPAEAWRRATQHADDVEWGGSSFQIGNATELLWHGMSHSFVDGSIGFRLRTFLDGAVILASGRAVDWSIIEHRIAGDEVRIAESEQVVSPTLQWRWIATAALLAGVAVPRAFEECKPFPIARLLQWKAMSRRMNVGRAMHGRLVEEATRAEFGMPLTPSHDNDSAIARGRRRFATTAARVGYLGWRAVSR
jgi:hypothetical protein